MARDICSADEMYLEELQDWGRERNEELQHEYTAEDLVILAEATS